MVSHSNGLPLILAICASNTSTGSTLSSNYTSKLSNNLFSFILTSTLFLFYLPYTTLYAHAFKNVTKKARKFFLAK